MFAGIIEKTSRVISAEDRGGIRRVRIKLPAGWRVVLGQSIAIDGICSTIAGTSKDSFIVEYMPETLTKTTAGAFVENDLVNLERSVTLKTFIDGHLVQGHIDARARVMNSIRKEEVHTLTIALPVDLRRFVAGRGSITINGVALTVAAKNKTNCTVALIPYTIAHTNLGLLKKGDEVNIETDLIARYLAALQQT